MRRLRAAAVIVALAIVGLGYSLVRGMSHGRPLSYDFQTTAEQAIDVPVPAPIGISPASALPAAKTSNHSPVTANRIDDAPAASSTDGASTAQLAADTNANVLPNLPPDVMPMFQSALNAAGGGMPGANGMPGGALGGGSMPSMSGFGGGGGGGGGGSNGKSADTTTGSTNGTPNELGKKLVNGSDESNGDAGSNGNDDSNGNGSNGGNGGSSANGGSNGSNGNGDSNGGNGSNDDNQGSNGNRTSDSGSNGGNDSTGDNGSNGGNGTNAGDANGGSNGGGEGGGSNDAGITPPGGGNAGGNGGGGDTTGPAINGQSADVTEEPVTTAGNGDTREVPEPGSILLGIGAVAAFARRRRH